MSSADMRATETGAATWSRTAEMSSAAAAEMGTAAKVAAAATDMTATTAANMTATTAAGMAPAPTASLRRRGDGTGQNDRYNNSQYIEFRHGTLEARGLR